MAYQPRPPYDNNPPVQESQSQHHSSPWSHQHRASGQEHMLIQRPVSPSLVEPESEDSDVSAAEDDLATFSLPIGLPPAPSKSSLESQQVILLRLEDLERHENHNIKKHNRLKEKRQRMDDKIARKRIKQDQMWKLIIDARGRRDSRIKQRRDREDIAFQRFYEDLEEEENVSKVFDIEINVADNSKRLRQRLKRIKRGLPMDENPTHSRRPSFNSPTSPVATSYSTVPPPAKRRRTSQPPYQEPPASRPPEMMQNQLPPVDRHPYPYHPHHGPPPPATPYSNQGHHQQYHPPPPLHSPTNHSRPPPDLGPYPPNGYHNSPHVPQAATAPPASTPTQAPRPSMSTYDTRPPPPASAPVSSGFAAVNQPPHSGFAAVNSRPGETPPALNSALMREPMHKQSSTPVDETPVRPGMGEEKGSSGSGSAANKRTPSTTHPYQMSEAFANRHHHCERIDSINRGIWTWYGPGGTQDRPTAPPTEMYLKCNHDNCGRIDWRTVHGLQCHIVKNHEQPKGTIGSLEKALAAYGVPVRDIEEIEKRDGLGSGGTMADPKNVKVRAAKIRDSGDRRDLSGRDTPLSVGGPPSLNKQQRSTNSDSPTAIAGHRAPDDRRPFIVGDHRIDGSASSPIDVDRPPHNRPVSGFAAVNSGWANINHKPNPPPQTLNRDHVPRDLPTPDRQSTNPMSGEPRSPPAPPPSFWSGWQPKPLFASPKPPQPPVEHINQPAQQAQPPQTPPRNPAADGTPKSSTMLSISREMAEAKANDVAIIPTAPEGEKLDETIRRDAALATETEDVTMAEAPVLAKPIDLAKEEDVPKASHDERAKSPEKTPVPEVRITEDRAERSPAPAPTNEERNIDGQADESIVNPPAKEIGMNIKEENKTSPRSPVVGTKRVMSRRESRRASIATASSKVGTDKGKEDDREAANSRAATENTVDDDGDAIEVTSALSKAEQKERERLKEDESNQTPPKRLANGRFTRRSLQQK